MGQSADLSFIDAQRDGIEMRSPQQIVNDPATCLKLKHVDLVAGSVNQDAREVKTKFSKTFNTFFFPVGDEIRGIVSEYRRQPSR